MNKMLCAALLTVVATSAIARVSYVLFGDNRLSYGEAINNAGVAVGMSGSGNFTAFIRSANGTIDDFSVSGADSTIPSGINDSGTVVGLFSVKNPAGEFGFIRDPDGTITTFSYPGATITVGRAINSKGEITGDYIDTMAHGLIRRVDGKLVSFDAPGGTSGTVGTAINSKGDITGTAFGADTVGFVRDSVGNYEEFSPSGSISTYPNGISQDGTITGIFDDSSYHVHGFVRSPEGAIIEFDPPGSVATTAFGINSHNAIAGSYLDSAGASHGFVRSPDGTIKGFDVKRGFGPQESLYAPRLMRAIGNPPVVFPTQWDDYAIKAPSGALQAVPEKQPKGTFPEAINDSGEIVGSDVVNNRTSYAFLRLH